MGQEGWWPRARTLLLAHVLGAAILGLCQFAITSVRDPMACCPTTSPWHRLCYWLESGCAARLTDSYEDFEIRRFGATLAGVVLVGLLFGWSLWSISAFRPPMHVRIRTLMALIAIVALELTAGTAAWDGWKKWERSRRFTTACVTRLAMPEIVVQPGDSLFVEVFEALPDYPITGTWTVHTDGRIDLGNYGRVYVDGLTLSEVKEKIVLHLRAYLDDENLGLIGSSEFQPLAVPQRISPSESSYVFVDFWYKNASVGGAAQ
jgi:Polysaccharide biosynthesis/export protein